MCRKLFADDFVGRQRLLRKGLLRLGRREHEAPVLRLLLVVPEIRRVELEVDEDVPSRDPDALKGQGPKGYQRTPGECGEALDAKGAIDSLRRIRLRENWVDFNFPYQEARPCRAAFMCDAKWIGFRPPTARSHV